MLLVTIHVTKIGTLLWNRVDQTPQPPDDDDGHHRLCYNTTGVGGPKREQGGPLMDFLEPQKKLGGPKRELEMPPR